MQSEVALREVAQGDKTGKRWLFVQIAFLPVHNCNSPIDSGRLSRSNAVHTC